MGVGMETLLKPIFSAEVFPCSPTCSARDVQSVQLGNFGAIAQGDTLRKVPIGVQGSAVVPVERPTCSATF